MFPAFIIWLCGRGWVNFIALWVVYAAILIGAVTRMQPSYLMPAVLIKKAAIPAFMILEMLVLAIIVAVIGTIMARRDRRSRNRATGPSSS